MLIASPASANTKPSVTCPNSALRLVTMLDGNIVLYRRTRTRKWQARFKIGSYWKRVTTKCLNLENAKDVALEHYMECMFKHRHGIPAVTKRFRDIARLCVA